MSDADEARAGASSESAAAAVEEEPREAESKALGGNEGLGDGARVVVPEQGVERVVVPEREARRAAPETGDAVSPYAQAATPTAQDATPRPVQTEDAASAEERRGRVARVREGTRARVENTRARVERVKGDALYALEETPDDSGLRFVAVAVALFVLFAFFLILSVTVLR